MKQTADPLDVDSNTEFEELNNLISTTVFSSFWCQADEEISSSQGLDDSLQVIEWNKISTLFNSNNLFIFPSCRNKVENSLSVSNDSTTSNSNESQANQSPDTSPKISPAKNATISPPRSPPLKLNSSPFIVQPSYIPINKFDDILSQFPYIPKQNGQRGLDSEKSIIHLSDIVQKKDKRTTLMIRHIPNKYTLKLFTNEINQKFKNKYDVFYLPIDYVNNCNLGFAFINFIDPLHIVEFYETFRGKKWKKYFSDKICELAYAKIQGKQNLMVHFEKGSVLNYQTEEKKPLILPTPDKLPKIHLPIKFLDEFKECFPKTSFTYDKEKKHILFDNTLIN